MAVVLSASIHVIGQKTESQTLVGIDGKIGLEVVIARQFVSGTVISQVGKRRFRVGKAELVRPDVEMAIYISKKTLAMLIAVKKDARLARRPKVSQVIVLSGKAFSQMCILVVMLQGIYVVGHAYIAKTRREGPLEKVNGNVRYLCRCRITKLPVAILFGHVVAQIVSDAR